MTAEAPSELVAGVYCSESFAADEKNQDLIDRMNPEIVAESVFQSVSDTLTPQGILAVVRQQSYSLDDLCREGRPLLILESIQDPGNLGTMLRTGETKAMVSATKSRIWQTAISGFQWKAR